MTEIYRGKTNKFKRFLSLFLTLCILVGSVRVPNIHATENKFEDSITIFSEESADAEESSDVSLVENEDEEEFSEEELENARETEKLRYLIKDNEVIILSLVNQGETSVEIPDEIEGLPVTRIANRAFYFNELTSVLLGNNVKSIGEYAFAGNNLEELILPNSVKDIEKAAFKDNRLRNLNLNQALNVAEYAFSNNELQNINLGIVESLGSFVFSNNELSEVEVPSSLTTVGSNIFSFNNRFVRLLSDDPNISIPKIQKIQGGHGYVLNSVTIVVDYIDDENDAKLLDTQTLGDDYLSEKDIFAKGVLQTYIPEEIDGYEPILVEGKDGVEFTPNENGHKLEVRYRKKTEGLSLTVAPSKLLMVPVNADNVEELLKEFVVARNKDDEDLIDRVEIEPSTIDTSVEGSVHKVVYTLRSETGEVKRLTLSIYVGTDMNNFPLGNDWTLGDFKYGGGEEARWDNDPTHVIGFSDSGLAKVNGGNKELILPHINPITGDRITYVNGTFRDDRDRRKYTFREKGLTSIKDFDKNIVEIGTMSTFEYNPNLTEVSLPSLRIIGDHAFHNTGKLQEFDFSKIERVDRRAFYNSGIKKVDAPNLVRVGDEAFMTTMVGTDPDFPQGFYFPKLESENAGIWAFKHARLTYIDNKVQMPRFEEIPTGYFENNDITDVNLVGIHTIKEHSFKSQRNKPDININAPDTTIIKQEAFRYNGITRLNLPKVESIHSWVFANNNLVSIDAPVVTEIFTGAFHDNNDKLESISFPEVTRIHSHAFGYNRKLKEVNLPKVERIDNRAFEFTAIEELDLPVLRMTEEYAFQHSKIREARLKVVESLGIGVFWNNNNFDENPGVKAFGNVIPIYTDNTELPSRENYIVNPEDTEDTDFAEDDFTWDSTDENKVTGLTNKGKSKLIAKGFHLRFPNRVLRVADSAFRWEKIKTVVGNEVLEVGAYAFHKNPLTKVEMPKLTTIRNRAFSENLGSEGNKLRSFNFDNVTTIEERAFEYAGLEGLINLPVLEVLEERVFLSNKISNINAPKLKVIKTGAFWQNHLTSLNKEMLPVIEELHNDVFGENDVKGVIDLPTLKKLADYRTFYFNNRNYKEPVHLILGSETNNIHGNNGRLHRFSEDLFYNTTDIPGKEHYEFRRAPVAFIFTAPPNEDGTLDRTNPKGFIDFMKVAGRHWRPSLNRHITPKTRTAIINPSTLKVKYELLDGNKFDGLEGRPKLPDFREFIYEEQLPRDTETGEFKTHKRYVAPQLDGYILVSSRDTDGSVVNKRAIIDVPFEADGHKTDREITFTYKPIEYNDINGPRLEFGISNSDGVIVGKEQEYISNSPSDTSDMPQMLLSFSIEEVKKEIKKGKIKLSFDSPYIDPDSIVLAFSDATDAWYSVDRELPEGAVVTTDTGMEIKLHENIPPGQALRGANIKLRYKKGGITPDQTTTRVKLIVVDEDSNGNEQVIAQVDPIELKLVYKPTPTITAKSRLNLPGYDYNGYNDASGGPRYMGALVDNPHQTDGHKVVEDPDVTSFYYTVDNVFYLMDQVSLRTEIPTYIYVHPDGREEERLAEFDAERNPSWTLLDDGKTLVFNQTISPTRDVLKINRILPRLDLKFPGLKEKTNVVNKVNASIRPYRDPRDNTLNSNVVATGDLGVGDSLTIYALHTEVPQFRPSQADRSAYKSSLGTPRSYDGATYMYDNPEDREKDITFKLSISSTNELEDFKNVSIIDYDLDSRLKYKTLKFNDTKEAANNMRVLVLGYRKLTDKLNPKEDTVVFEQEAAIDNTKDISFSDGQIDYFEIKLLDTENKPLDRGLSFTVVTRLKDEDKSLFDTTNTSTGNTMINRALFLGDVYKKGTDEKIGEKPSDSEYEHLDVNNITRGSAGVSILQYKVNVGIDKSLVSFDTRKIDSYKRYPSAESGEVVLEGERGAYHIKLNTAVEGSPHDKAKVVLNNLEIIDVVPNGIEFSAADVELHPLFIKARGKFEILENYEVLDGGEVVNQKAIKFSSEKFDTRVYGDKPIYIASINTKYNGKTLKNVVTNRVYAKWDNEDVTTISPATNSDKTKFLDPHQRETTEDNMWAYSEAAIKVTSSSGLVPSLYIRNRRDNVWQTSTFTDSQEGFDYKLVISNFDKQDDAIPYAGIDIINIIPGLEDYKLNKRGLRGTEFEPKVDLSRINTDLRLPEGYRITYLNTDTSIHDLLDGRSTDDLLEDSSFTWETSPRENMKAFRVTANDGTLLHKGKTIEIIFPMIAPRIADLDSELIGKRAVNSYAVRHYENGTTTYNRVAEVSPVYNYMAPPKGKVIFKKYGKIGELSLEETAVPLEGAGFELVDRDLQLVVAAAYSNAEGVVTFSDVDTSKNYEIKEFIAPETYIISRNTPYRFSREDFKRVASNNFTIELDDAKSKELFMNIKAIEGNIRIVKKTRDDISTIPNISFRIRGLDRTNNDFDEIFTTSEDGTIQVNRLKEGRYEVEEIESTAINRYQKAPNQTVRIDFDNRDHSLTFVNDKFQVLLRKIIVDDESVMDPAKWDQLTDFGKKKVPGYRFRVEGEDGQVFTTNNTQNDGTVILQNLKTDVVYTVTELPNNQLSGNLKNLYTHNEREYKFKITHDGKLINANNNKRFKQYALNIPNTPKEIRGKVVVRKTDDKSPANNLQGATIRISRMEFNSAGEIASLEKINEEISAENGEVEFDNLLPGTYQIEEVNPPLGYLLNKNKIEITIPSKVVDSMATNNDYNKDDPNIIKLNLSRTIVNKESSVSAIKGSDIPTHRNILLQDARAYIEENRAEYPNLTTRATGRALYTVYNPLEGVKFNLYKSVNGVVEDTPIEIDGSVDLLTNQDGKINFGSYKFEYDQEYSLIEKESIDGYVKYEGIKSFKLSEEAKKPNFKGELSFYINNLKEEGSILVSKYDGFNRRSLEGAVFEIFAGDKASANLNRPLREIRTRKDGYAYFDKLPFGTYVVREKEVPKGYKLPEEDVRVKEVVISRDSPNKRITIFNKKVLDIPITKVWANNSSSEESVKVRLLRSTSKNANFTPVVIENFTDSEGIVSLSANEDETKNWKTVFEGLDRSDDNGKRYYYKVEELDSNNNPYKDLYETTISGTEETGFTITNTDKQENKLAISVTKVFELNKAELPENASIKVALYKLSGESADASKSVSENEKAGVVVTKLEEQVLNSGNNWQHTFTNLVKRVNGVDIVYRIEEIDMPTGFVSTNRYNSANNSFTITNIANKRNRVAVIKEWEGIDNNDNTAPEIKIELWDKLDLNKEGASPLETQVVTKKYILNANSEQELVYIAEFKNIPSYKYEVNEDGQLVARKITYALREKYLDDRERSGYIASSNAEDAEVLTYLLDDNITNSIDLKIRNELVKQNIEIQKEWIGVEASDAPTVRFKLIDVTLDDSEDLSNTETHIEVSNEIVLSYSEDEATNFKTLLRNLPRYKEDGYTEIKYAVKELSNLAGYTFTQKAERVNDGLLRIVGTNTRLKRNLRIEKEWSNVSSLFSDSQEDIPNVLVDIYADKTGSTNYTVKETDKIINAREITLDKASKKYVLNIENLDKYAEDGSTEIKYYVVERALEAFVSNATETSPKLLQKLTEDDDTLKATITNTRKTAKIKVRKIWDGLLAYSEEERQNLPNLTMELYVKLGASSEETKVTNRSVNLELQDANSYIFEGEFVDLPLYSINGDKFTYSVKEKEKDTLIGYVSEITQELPEEYAVGENAENLVEFTNTVKTVDILVNKTWTSREEDSISIFLKKNGVRTSENPVVVTRNNVIDNKEFSYKFTNLPRYEINGVSEITYDIEELPILGYETNIEASVEDTSVEDTSAEDTSAEDTSAEASENANSKKSNKTYVITNTFKTVDIDVSKEFTLLEDELRPEVVLVLTDNTEGRELEIADKEIRLNSQNNFRGTFADLPKYKVVRDQETNKDIEKQIVYGIKEKTEVPGYIFSYTSNVSEDKTKDSPYGKITLSAKNERVLTNLKFIKAWGSDLASYTRPEVVFKVYKTANDENPVNAVETSVLREETVEGSNKKTYIPVSEIRLNKRNNFTSTFKAPKYEADGTTLIKYFASENDIAGYESDLPESKKVLLTADETDTLSATVTNSLKVRNVKVEKEWQGLNLYNEAELSKIPRVSVELYDATNSANKIKVREVKALVLDTQDNKYKATYENLPKYKEDGTTEIVYEVKEVEEASLLGYEASYSPSRVDRDGNIVLSISNQVKTITIDAVKEWVGVEAANAPEITLTLVGGTGVNLTNKSLTLNNTNSYRGSFGNLPLYEIDGKTKIVYSVRESGKAGYSFSQTQAVEDEKLVIRGRNERKKRPLKISKEFTSDLSGYERPEVEVQILRQVENEEKEVVSFSLDNEIVDRLKLNKANGFTKKISGFDKYDALGEKEYKYFVRESEVAGYNIPSEDIRLVLDAEENDDTLSATVTNSLKVRNVKVEKGWQGLNLYNEAELNKIPRVSVELYDATNSANKIKVREVKALVLDTQDNKYKATYENLPKYKEDGTTEIVYEVKEVEEASLLGYEASYSPSSVDRDGNIVLSISNQVKTITIDAVKEWVGVEAANAPEITLTLVGGTGVNLTNKSLTLNNTNSYRGSFGNLPLYEIDGKTKIVYSVRESGKVGYSFSQTQAIEDEKLVIRGRNERKKRSLKISKEFTSDLSGYERPEVEVQILRQLEDEEKEVISFRVDNETVDKLILNKANNFTKKISGFDKYDALGEKEYKYFVRESEVAGYNIPSEDIRLVLDAEENDDTLSATVTNSLKVRDIIVNKTWLNLDFYGEDAIKHVPNVSAVLYDVTIEDSPIELEIKNIPRTKDATWQVVFENKPRYKEDGITEIKYKVLERYGEDSIIGYKSTYYDLVSDEDENLVARIDNTLRTRNVIVNKTFEGKELKEIEVTLLINDVASEERTVKISKNEEDVYTHTYLDMPYYELDGKTLVRYDLKEKKVPYYKYELSQEEVDNDLYDENFKDLVFNLKNIYDPPSIYTFKPNKPAKKVDEPSQVVEIVEDEVPEENNIFDKIINLPKTGDYTNVFIYILAFVFSILSLFILFFKRKREYKKN